MFSFARKAQHIDPPLSLLAATEVSLQVYRIRDGIAVGRDSDGNRITVRYPDGIVEEAAKAASMAPDLPTSLAELERVFVEAEQRTSTAVHTS